MFNQRALMKTPMKVDEAIMVCQDRSVWRDKQSMFTPTGKMQDLRFRFFLSKYSLSISTRRYIAEFYLLVKSYLRKYFFNYIHNYKKKTRPRIKLFESSHDHYNLSCHDPISCSLPLTIRSHHSIQLADDSHLYLSSESLNKVAYKYKNSIL